MGPQDGVGLNAPKCKDNTVGSRTWLGLYHTFENGCSQRSDGIDDTPAERRPFRGCGSDIGRDTCSGDLQPDPVHNFMDFSSNLCQCLLPIKPLICKWHIIIIVSGIKSVITMLLYYKKMPIRHWSPWSPDNVNCIPLLRGMMWNVFGMQVKEPFGCIIIGTNHRVSIDCTIGIDFVVRSVVPLMSNIGRVRKWKKSCTLVSPHMAPSVMWWISFCVAPSPRWSEEKWKKNKVRRPLKKWYIK